MTEKKAYAQFAYVSLNESGNLEAFQTIINDYLKSGYNPGAVYSVKDDLIQQLVIVHEPAASKVLVPEFTVMPNETPVA